MIYRVNADTLRLTLNRTGLIFVACALPATLPVTLLAQTPPAAQTASQAASPLRELERYNFGYAYAGSQLKDTIYERSRKAFAAGDAARDAIKTAEALRARQAEIRRVVLEGIGGLPRSDTPLNARVTGTVAGEGFTIEKVIFEARPKQYVTTNLYLPAQRTGRTPAVLFLCGHHMTGKTVAEYQ